jgi:DNA repair exonuclease SbcCD ATPase subunit
MSSADEFKKDIEASKSSLENIENFRSAQSFLARVFMKDVDIDQSSTNPYLSRFMGELTLVEDPREDALDVVRRDERNFSEGRIIAVSNSLKAKEGENRLLAKKCETLQGRLNAALVAKEKEEERVVELRMELTGVRMELMDEKADKAEKIRMLEEEKRRAEEYKKHAEEHKGHVTQFAGLLEKYEASLNESKAELKKTKGQNSQLVGVVRKQRAALDAIGTPGAKAVATHRRSPLGEARASEAGLFASAEPMAFDKAKGSHELSSPTFGE